MSALYTVDVGIVVYFSVTGNTRGVADKIWQIMREAATDSKERGLPVVLQKMKSAHGSTDYNNAAEKRYDKTRKALEILHF